MPCGATAVAEQVGRATHTDVPRESPGGDALTTLSEDEFGIAWLLCSNPVGYADISAQLYTKLLTIIARLVQCRVLREGQAARMGEFRLLPGRRKRVICDAPAGVTCESFKVNNGCGGVHTFKYGQVYTLGRVANSDGGSESSGGRIRNTDRPKLPRNIVVEDGDKKITVNLMTPSAIRALISLFSVLYDKQEGDEAEVSVMALAMADKRDAGAYTGPLQEIPAGLYYTRLGKTKLRREDGVWAACTYGKLPGATFTPFEDQPDLVVDCGKAVNVIELGRRRAQHKA